MRRRPPRIAPVVALVLCTLACGGAGRTAALDHHGVDRALPPVEIALLGGGTWRSDAARGDVLVVDVWASWCAPCRKGFPLLDDIARRRAGARFIAISIDEDEAAARAFVDRQPTDIPIAIDPAGTATAASWHVERVPTILVVDRRGVVRLRLVEPEVDDYALVDRAIATLLAE